MNTQEAEIQITYDADAKKHPGGNPADPNWHYYSYQVYAAAGLFDPNALGESPGRNLRTRSG